MSRIQPALRMPCIKYVNSLTTGSVIGCLLANCRTSVTTCSWFRPPPMRFQQLADDVRDARTSAATAGARHGDHPEEMKQIGWEVQRGGLHSLYSVATGRPPPAAGSNHCAPQRNRNVICEGMLMNVTGGLGSGASHRQKARRAFIESHQNRSNRHLNNLKN